MKIAVKSRRIGYSFAAGLQLVLACLERKTTCIILSRGERQAKEFISEFVAPHIKANAALARFTEFLK